MTWHAPRMPRVDVELLEEEWDEDFRPPPGRQYSVAATERISRDEVARVVTIDRGRVSVLLDGQVVDAAYGGSMRGRKTAVGDRVRVRPPGREGGVARLSDVLPRETVLQRTGDDRDAEPRLLAANLDQVVVVVAADHLGAGVRFLDRVLVAAEDGGVEPVVCCNKVDVAVAGELAKVAGRYERIGYQVLLTSAETGEGIERLRWQCAGAWTALAGHSGVGKSSLYNLLVPAAHQEVAELGPRGGRHTTVAARADPVPGVDDAWLVDTPGVRSFGLGFVDPDRLWSAFPELRGWPCALDDCTHLGEPGCALDRQAIHPARLATYRRLLASLRGEDGYDSDEWSDPVSARDPQGPM